MELINNIRLRAYYLTHALRARRWYKKHRNEHKVGCLACVWEHIPEDEYLPWNWITCDKCNWGNE